MTSTRKIAYSGAATALAVAAMGISLLLQLRFAPLIIAAVSYCFVWRKCGALYSLITIAASLMLGFFIIGFFSTPFLLTAIAFAPYSILFCLIKKLTYKKPLLAAIRVAIIICFSIIVVNILVALVQFLTIDLTYILSLLGQFWIFVAVCAVFILLFDIVFISVMERVERVVK